MSLRRPPAPETKPKTWKRSSDSSHRDRPRPHSAIEGGGGQLDAWIQHLQRLQRTNREQSVDKEVHGPTRGGLLSSRGSSSSLGSEESGPTPPERSDSWERARIGQTARKEQSRVSFLTPVKIGWLPVRRRATVVGDKGRDMDTTGQVKLKQPITPTVLKNASAKSCNEEEEKRSQSRAEGVRTQWQTPNLGSPTNTKIPEKRVPAVSDSSVSWQALKRGWRLNRVLALPGLSLTNKTNTGTSQDRPDVKPTLPNQSKDLPHRTSSVQPVKASHIETTSATKTLIPENKAGFSSITISSRKVCRSASLPLSDKSTDTNSNQIMVQRKATIVKVTQQTTTTTSPIRNDGQNQPSSSSSDTVVHRRKATIIKVTEHRESFTHGNASSQQKKNEFRHSYSEGFPKQKDFLSPENHAMQSSTSLDSQLKNNEYRNSYSEGLYKQNGILSREIHAVQSSTPLDPQQKKNEYRNSYSEGLNKQNGVFSRESLIVQSLDSKPMHRSTLSLIVSNTPAIEAPPSRSESSEKSNRKQRPSSCYGNVFSGSEANEERMVRSVSRKFSLGSTESSSDSMGVNGGEEMAPPLTLIKTPDPHQSPEEVLARNAAAIIANIKLQRQLCRKSQKDSTTQEKTETVLQDSVKDDRGSDKTHTAAFVPLSNDCPETAHSLSLQEALRRSRPDLISRSRRRTEERERRVQQRKRKSSAQAQHASTHTNTRDQLSKPSNRAVMRKGTTMMRRRQEEEAPDSSLNNRRRAERFKKI